MKRSGVADLPLHRGRVPEWLAARMTTLGTAIAGSMIYHYGKPSLLSRLSDPLWFQTLGCVMGMDWHSSGITTSGSNNWAGARSSRWCASPKWCTARRPGSRIRPVSRLRS